jgi:hypothetical protein
LNSHGMLTSQPYGPAGTVPASSQKPGGMGSSGHCPSVAEVPSASKKPGGMGSSGH